MENLLLCSVCENDYTHILGTIEAKDDDRGKTVELIVNHQHSIPVQVPYSYRTQGNLHILFRCEDGHFFFKSFDGHKGNVFVDDNKLMDDLAKNLNAVYNTPDKGSHSFDYELLGNIEKYLKSREEKKYSR